MVQLESENHRLSRDLALLVRQSYDRDRSAFDSLNNEVLKGREKKQARGERENLVIRRRISGKNVILI